MAASLYFLSCFSCLGVTDSTSLSSSFCTSVPLFSFLVFVIFNPFLFLYLWLASVLMPVAAVFCPWWFFFHLTPTFCLHGYAFAILLRSVPSSSPSFLSLSLSLSLSLYLSINLQLFTIDASGPFFTFLSLHKKAALTFSLNF